MMTWEKRENFFFFNLMLSRIRARETGACLSQASKGEACTEVHRHVFIAGAFHRCNPQEVCLNPD